MTSSDRLVSGTRQIGCKNQTSLIGDAKTYLSVL